MDKEKLIAMGLTEEQAGKVMESLNGNFVTKARFNEINEENKTLRQSVSDRDKQLDGLKAAGSDNADLKKQIEALQQQNAEREKSHKEELERLKLENAIDAALAAAGAKNVKAAKALLDASKIKLGEDGRLSGWEDQINEMQKSDSYLFADKREAGFQFRGFSPGASSDMKLSVNVDMSKMSYEELAAYIEGNPDA